MKRFLVVAVGLVVGVALTAGLATAGSSKAATITIAHVKVGCHDWAFNGGKLAPSLNVRVARGTTITFVDNDVMSHKLVQKGGPAAQFVGKPVMNHVGASVKVVFTKAGVYTFKTIAGEDYAFAKNVKTVGEDHVLKLKVVVS